MNIEYEVVGADSLAVRVRGENEEVREKIIDAISDALRAAHIEMKLRIPVDSGEAFNSINLSPVRFSPGGLGGGGFWEGELNVGEGVEHLGWLVEGTPGGGSSATIFPKRGNVLRFQKRGEEPKVRPFVSGQDPQDEWLEAAQAVASAIVAQRVSSI